MKKEKTTLTNHYFFIFFFLITSIVLSQQKRFEISWANTTTLATEVSKVEIPHFNKENFSFSYDKGLSFVSQWKESSFINESSVSISNVNYQPITRDQLKDLDTSKIPNEITYSLKNATARDINYAFLEVSPIVNRSGQLSKVTSFTINYALGRASISNRNSQAITSSILNSGNWKRFYVEKSGVFKLSRSFIKSLGFNTNVDPRTIKIYGNGGRMLSQLNSEFVPFDPEENAIKLIGEEDGVFNSDDYILFYAEGPFEYDNSVNNDTHVNIFTEKTYYYITSSAGFGKRIQPMAEPDGNPDITVNSFQDYQFHELDEENLGAVGRRWFGNEFLIESSQTFDFEFPNIDTSIPIDLKVLVGVVSAATGTSMEVSLNSSPITSFTNFGIVQDAEVASGGNYVGQHTVSSSLISIGLNYNNNGSPAANAFVDYISIEATRALSYVDGQFRFKNKDVVVTPGIAQYVIDNASQVSEVWDVTDIYNVSSVNNTDSVSQFNFKTNSGSDKLYIALAPSDYFQPKKDSNANVSNQDIKGTIFQNAQGEFQDVDYLIIARSDMLSQANRLAEINRNQYNLNVKVLSLKDIYAEFNNGNPDVSAIRNLVKYVYDNASAPENRIKYLCLFGDGSYDYKDRVNNNTNVVPSWTAYSSFNLTNSFISDDFYGMMDENEGSMASFNKLDIATGRILADTPKRARELVDKIEGYYDEEALGSWRNNFIAISDDVDVDWERILQQTTNDIANQSTAQQPYINPIKVHSDAFLQEASAGGARYPSVNEYIKDKVDVGALVVNYFGHGGEDGLARERIFDKNNAQDVRNVCRLNCFVTVTCEYTRFDNPNRETAGEFTYWNKDGGAIALITTTRQIFVNVGVAVNEVLTGYLFPFNSQEQTSAAEALRLTKNDPLVSGVEQRRLVFFIGDPALRLSFPKPGIRLTKINDVDIAESTDVLQALGYAKISGEIVDTSGNVLNNFNGTLSATIYDKEIDRQTLANDGTTFNGQLIVLDFKTLGEAIFRGQASVENGQFEFDFIVPRDIGIPVGNGKVSFYAKQENSLIDYAGANLEIPIGGINENAEEDNIGPTIALFMNDESFVSGGITNEQPTLLAKLNDEHGINTASGIGHDIVAILDGNETEPFVLNDYYQADVDDYQKGAVSFQFRDLEPGLHTLSFKAWDVYNNSTTTEVQFVVKDKDDGLVINNVLNYPNPFIDYTEFWFNHNSADILDVSVQIFTVSGKIVRTLNGQTTGGSKNPSSLSRDIVWDGRDDFGDKIGKGVYIYKLKVRSNQLNKQVEKIQKLVIL